MGAGSPWYQDLLHPVNHKESYRGETKSNATTSKILIHCAQLTHFTIYDLRRLSWVHWEGRSPVNRHSMQSYILTNSRLRKREPLKAWGFHQGGPQCLCLWYLNTERRGGPRKPDQNLKEQDERQYNIKLDNFLVPMQCTGNVGAFPWKSEQP